MILKLGFQRAETEVSETWGIPTDHQTCEYPARETHRFRVPPPFQNKPQLRLHHRLKHGSTWDMTGKQT